jgi:hypothetical protein
MDEEFVTHSVAEDLNFDGYVDVKAPRDFGAKWRRYCVWLFDPQFRNRVGGPVFIKDSLAEQMELLYNLQVDPKHDRILASDIGPVDSLRDEYRIEPVGKNRPYWPRLIPVRSCFIDSGSALKLDAATAYLTEYVEGQSVIKNAPMGSHSDCDISEECDCVQQATENR